MLLPPGGWLQEILTALTDPMFNSQRREAIRDYSNSVALSCTYPAVMRISTVGSIEIKRGLSCAYAI